MIDLLKAHWDKLLGFLSSIAVAVFLFYRRFFRMEDKLAAHIVEDRELKARLDAGIKDLGEMKVQLTRHEVLIGEVHTDVRELREDVRSLLRRR